MHAFALVMAAVLAHPHFRSRVAEAQRIVTYFRASHQPLAMLNDAIRSQGINGGGLQSSNKTRFTSVHLMLASINRVEGPLRSVLSQPDIIKPGPVRESLGSTTFWREIDIMCKLLQPFTQVIMAIQSRDATLADVTRYWLYLARCLERLQFELPTTGSAGVACGMGCMGVCSWLGCMGCSLVLASPQPPCRLLL